MKREKEFYLWLYLLIGLMIATGCGVNNEMEISELISIGVELPQVDGWSTDKTIYTRSNKGNNQFIEEGKDGLGIHISTYADVTVIPPGKAVTRWVNLDDNTIFRIVAYACKSATDILTSNYKGYGDYKLSSDGTVQVLSSLKLPSGTYTFIGYSYGNAIDIPTFDNTTTNVTATNGENFMTCVKENIIIDDTGGIYILSGLTFIHHCVRYRVKVQAQSGRMQKITACSGSLTLPGNSGTYSFSNGAFTTNTTTGNLNITWSTLNAMEVYSNYTYILPISEQTITITLNPSIGGKAFSNKSTDIKELTFSNNGTYCSTVSFNTSQGYLVAGTFWASGNLYKSGSSYLFYTNTETYGGEKSGGLFTCNNPNPYPDLTKPTTTWTETNDPCRKFTNATGKWRLPTSDEMQRLVNSGYTPNSVLNGISGYLFGNILFLPYTGYIAPTGGGYYDNDKRGLFWTSEGKAWVYARPGYGGSLVSQAGWTGNNLYTIRCVRI